MDHDLDKLSVPEPLRPFALFHLDSAEPLRRIAEMLALDGFVDRVAATDLARCAIELRRAAPDDRVVWEMTNPILYHGVPEWHWRMVNDLPRNTAYQRAIDALIEPGMTVLEIGAGTGLLAMMAARAGADHVYTVEKNQVMAMVARDCIAANDLAGRITVIEGKSGDLELGGALPRRCDALIHEIMSTNLLSEGVIGAVAHAREALLAPGAVLLPERIWAMGVLSDDPLAGKRVAGTISGFDLSALTLIGPASLASGNGPSYMALSAPGRLAEFDLTTIAGDASGTRRATLEATREAVAHGVEQWLGIGFPDGTSLESLNPRSNWGRFFHPFGRARPVAAGERVTLAIDHAPRRLCIGLASL